MLSYFPKDTQPGCQSWDSRSQAASSGGADTLQRTVLPEHMNLMGGGVARSSGKVLSGFKIMLRSWVN